MKSLHPIKQGWFESRLVLGFLASLLVLSDWVMDWIYEVLFFIKRSRKDTVPLSGRIPDEGATVVSLMWAQLDVRFKNPVGRVDSAEVFVDDSLLLRMNQSR